MRIMAILCVLSLLIGGVALMPSSLLEAADWISDADLRGIVGHGH